MYTYGGMYLDDDSDIRTPLDEVWSILFYTLKLYSLYIIFQLLSCIGGYRGRQINIVGRRSLVHG